MALDALERIDARPPSGEAAQAHPLSSDTPPKPRPTVAAVIVSWRTGPRLFECLQSVLTAPDIDEVILVDNGNPRETRVRLLQAATLRKDFRILWGHGNVGFGAGCNRGAEAATSSHLLFLNPDARLERGTADELLRAKDVLSAASGATAPVLIGGQVVGLDGREQRGCRRGDVTLWGAIVEFSGLKALRRVNKSFASVHYETDDTPLEPTPMPTVSGACMMISAADFRALGGFDEEYFLHVEDVDLCRRVRDAGGLVGFAPDAVVAHEGGTSPAAALKIGWYKGRGFCRYFRKFARSPVQRLLASILGPLIMTAALAHGVIRSRRRA